MRDHTTLRYLHLEIITVLQIHHNDLKIQAIEILSYRISCHITASILLLYHNSMPTHLPACLIVNTHVYEHKVVVGIEAVPPG